MPGCRWIVRVAVCLLFAARVGAEATLPPLQVQITGLPPYGDSIRQAVQVQLAGVHLPVQAAPYTLTRLLLPGPSPEEGKARWAMAHVQSAAFQPIAFDIPVQVTHIALADRPAQRYFFSNIPETVYTARTLFEGHLSPEQPARLLYHHVNGTSDSMVFSLELLNPSPTPVAVQVVDASCGPSYDEGGVGHQAAWTYADRERRDAGFIATVPANSLLAVSRLSCPSKATVSGLSRFRVLTNGARVILRLRMHAPELSGRTAPLFGYTPSTIIGDYCYAATQLDYEGSYTVGGPWLYARMGEILMPAERPRQELYGCYGIWHNYQFTASNPLNRAATIYLSVRAAGGPARLVYSLNGALRQTGLLYPDDRTVLDRFLLPAGGRRTIFLSALPESGSNYPIEFALSNDAP